jgi:hypothetical protein
MKLTQLAFSLILAASSVTVQASTEVILTESSQAVLSDKLFTGQATWNYDEAFDLNFSYAFTGTGSLDWVLTETGVGSETGSYAVGKTFGSTREQAWTDLSAGNYVLSYSGTLARGATFSETLISSRSPVFVVAALPIPSPVPEPATSFLMLSGLGVVGLMISRRRQPYSAA